jgi:hypothetical protein
MSIKSYKIRGTGVSPYVMLVQGVKKAADLEIT